MLFLIKKIIILIKIIRFSNKISNKIIKWFYNLKTNRSQNSFILFFMYLFISL